MFRHAWCFYRNAGCSLLKPRSAPSHEAYCWPRHRGGVCSSLTLTWLFFSSTPHKMDRWMKGWRDGADFQSRMSRSFSFPPQWCYSTCTGEHFDIVSWFEHTGIFSSPLLLLSSIFHKPWMIMGWGAGAEARCMDRITNKIQPITIQNHSFSSNIFFSMTFILYTNTVWIYT